MTARRPNRFHGQTYPYQMGLEDWLKCWKEENTGFHKTVPHSKLQKHLATVLNGRSNVKFFIPLCGKAVDIKCLADMGHTVIGVEGSETAVTDFFKEHQVEFSVEQVESVKSKLYKSEDGRIRLYVGDFFNFNSSAEGNVEAIWDRGSLVAIGKDTRDKYAEIMKELMSGDCRYLLDAFHYDEEVFAGPPYCVPQTEVQRLFGDSCDVQHLETSDYCKEKMVQGVTDFFDENLFLITLKK